MLRHLGLQLGITSVFVLLTNVVVALDLKIGDSAPAFKLQTQNAEPFDIATRKGSWTVLYFYPKAETPGCTKQACAFRDNIERIRKLGADVYGVSVNTVAEQSSFAKNHNINFELLADSDAKVSELYGVKMPILKMAKRWTFIIDPDLKIQAIDRDVDPVLDAEHVAEKISIFSKAAAAKKGG